MTHVIIADKIVIDVNCNPKKLLAESKYLMIISQLLKLICFCY